MGSALSGGLYPRCCATADDSDSREYEPLLAVKERQAIGSLMQILESNPNACLYEGEPQLALSTLAYSDAHSLQYTAATALSEVSEFDVRAVDAEIIKMLLYMLNSAYDDVQHSASSALGNLSVELANQHLIVKHSGLDALVRQMFSPSVGSQINAVGCITNLAMAEENKGRIIASGALVPLTRLARSQDTQVRRNATGALLNMSHAAHHRRELANTGAVPVLMELLDVSDQDTQYYAAAALSNIAVDAEGRQWLAPDSDMLVDSLVILANAVENTDVQAQAMMTLRNLASDGEFQLKIVQRGGLVPVGQLLQSTSNGLVSAAAACLRNLSIHSDNETPIVETGLISNVASLVPQAEDPEIQRHATCLIEAGMMESFQVALANRQTQSAVVAEMLAAINVFAISDQLWPFVLAGNMLEILIPMTRSRHAQIQIKRFKGTGVAAPFIQAWRAPRGGLQGYLAEALVLPVYANMQSIAVWTVRALLASGSKDLVRLIREDSAIVSAIEDLAKQRPPHASYTSTAAPSSASSFITVPTTPVANSHGKGADYEGDVLGDSDQSTVGGEPPAAEADRIWLMASKVAAALRDGAGVAQ
ncbi:ARM repeat-containing protein [Linderina pennispora]|uniref:Vacuolar protein 8 n=1 Tax=Linderina pennispora TaxID=61395 RepID=A0A1Y1W4J0_9FUNG|nr:ARM repeat-containing protein [Linderina pennispora]ORX68156.1 ARM repeat-containing protein [Linderina pennispora]